MPLYDLRTPPAVNTEVAADTRQLEVATSPTLHSPSSSRDSQPEILISESGSAPRPAMPTSQSRHGSHSTGTHSTNAIPQPLVSRRPVAVKPEYSPSQHPAYSQPKQPNTGQPRQPDYDQSRQPQYHPPKQPGYSQLQKPGYSQPPQPEQTQPKQPAPETQVPEPRKVSFGFLLVPLQLLDMAGPMDVLNNVSTGFVRAFAGLAQQTKGVSKPPSAEDLIASSLDITFHHIGLTLEPVLTTGGFYAKPTCTVANCPKLDYLLVGGPSPEYAIRPGKMPEPMKDFIRQRAEECQSIFSTCTGALVLAAAGVLDGQRATLNHAFLDVAAQAFPAVKWSKNKNWVVSNNGRFWTAGGACAGMDMMASWVKAQVSEDVFGLCTMALEYQPRDVDGKMVSFVNGRGEKVVEGRPLKGSRRIFDRKT